MSVVAGSVAAVNCVIALLRASSENPGFIQVQHVGVIIMASSFFDFDMECSLVSYPLHVLLVLPSSVLASC